MAQRYHVLPSAVLDAPVWVLRHRRLMAGIDDALDAAERAAAARHASEESFLPPEGWDR